MVSKNRVSILACSTCQPGWNGGELIAVFVLFGFLPG